MRIDDENKVVWCNGKDMKWYVSFNFSHGDNLGSILKIIEVLSAEREFVLPRPMDRNYRIKLIKAILDDYEFKLEQPKKYYWRKKKQHLANFEIGSSYNYLNVTNGECSLDSCIDGLHIKTKFTKQEAREILKGDFDMFVCEEVIE